MRTGVKILLYVVLAVCLWGSFGALLTAPGFSLRERVVATAWLMGVALLSGLINGYLSLDLAGGPKGWKAVTRTTPMVIIEVAYVAVFIVLVLISIASS